MYEKLRNTVNQGMIGLRWYVAANPENEYTSNAWNCPVAQWLQDTSGESVMVRSKAGRAYAVAFEDHRVMLGLELSEFIEEFDNARHAGILPMEVKGEELLLWMNRQ